MTSTRRLSFLCLALSLAACADDASDTTTSITSFGVPETSTTDEPTDTESGGEGDGDGDPGDGDPGDGDPGDGDPGDGDPGDGDGDPAAECGDGMVEGDEECDDGNQQDDDACTNACTLPVCGDSIVQAGEECDVGNETMFCDGDCTYVMCGDGYHNMLSEECDDGNSANDDECVGPCLLNVCGDSYLHVGVEECDDGNGVDTDECKNDCSSAYCGDGVIWEGVEECEDLNNDDTDACTNACLDAVCGDGIVQAGVEECDDGNMDPYDNCTTLCNVPTCGDGFLHMGENCDGNEFGGLQCSDFGNFNSGDLQCDNNCDIDSSMCTLGQCPSGGAFVNDHCWYASDVCETAVQKCQSVGLVGQNGGINTPWTQQVMDDVGAQLGLQSGGDVGCCVEFGWIDNGTIYTHNFGTFHNWSNCFNNFPTLKACQAP